MLYEVITPWKPFGELTTLRKEMDSLWDRFFLPQDKRVVVRAAQGLGDQNSSIADIGENLLTLRCKVSGADDIALPVHGQHGTFAQFASSPNLY